MAVSELSPSYKTQLSASQVSSLSTRFTNPRRILVPLLPRVKRVGIHCSVVSKSIQALAVGYPFQKLEGIEASAFVTKQSDCSSFKRLSVISRCSSTEDKNESSDQNKTPFGYTRKDVLLIGVGVTVVGVGLKSGLEFYGVDPLQAGNVVQLVIVLGLTVGWISTYMFRVSNKEMTYATQLRDYENKVMEKRLESLTEAELAVLMEQVEEEKLRVSSNEQIS